MDTKGKAVEAARNTHDKGSEIFHREKQKSRLLKALLSGRKLSVVDIVLGLKIADPRAVIRDLRKEGEPIADQWVESDRTRYKLYFMRPTK